MRREIATALALLALVAAISLIDVAVANPFSQASYKGEMTPPPKTTAPTINIALPANNSRFNQNSILFKLDVALGETPKSFSTYALRWLTLTEVYFEADWVKNITILRGPSELDGLYPEAKNAYSYRIPLNDIPDGKHSIMVNATERGYYYKVQGGVSFEYYGFSKSTVQWLSFTVDTVPKIHILPFENTTFDEPQIPLKFFVDQTVMQVTYSLDKQVNVTIAGNTTLTDIANGQHELILYATDHTGHTGISNVLNFRIAASQQTPEPETSPAIPIIPVIAGLSAGCTALSLVYVLRKRFRKTNTF